MSIEVRIAAPDDAGKLIALHRESDGSSHVSADVEYVRRSIASNENESVYVGCLAGKIVGFAALQMTRSFCYTRPTAELTELFVAEPARRNGVASKLIDAVVSKVKQENGLEVFLRVNHANAGAIQLYESKGFIFADHHEYRIKY
jgi:GNAT superfamily N-acetyltransferase